MTRMRGSGASAVSAALKAASPQAHQQRHAAAARPGTIIDPERPALARRSKREGFFL
jgi:hypothetical protein